MQAASDSLAAVQEQLRVRFRKPALLRLALTHKSVANEAPESVLVEHNERLEFLGDAILGAVVADELYRAFPTATEGALTVMRAQLVRQSSLAELARRLHLEDHVILGRGEARAGGSQRESVLAACFEAIVGAIYLDRGERAARHLLAPFIDELAQGLTISSQASDPKSQLQHRAQLATGAPPTYRVLSQEGPDHSPSFTVEVEVLPDLRALGVGRSKQAAEQEAARRALEGLDQAGRAGPAARGEGEAFRSAQNEDPNRARPRARRS